MKRIPSHKGDVQHGIVKIDLVELSHHRHVPRQLFAGKVCDVLVIQTNDAAVHLLCAVDGAEQSGFAAAVGTQQGREFPVRHLNGEMLYNWFAGNRNVYIFRFQSHSIASKSIFFTHHHIDEERRTHQGGEDAHRQLGVGNQTAGDGIHPEHEQSAG